MEDFNKIVSGTVIKRSLFDRFIIWVMGSKVATVFFGALIVYLLICGIIFNIKLF